MIWRTDKPTEKIIVAKLTEDFCHLKDNYSLLYLTDKPYQHYCEYGEEIPYSAIEKWASLEEEKPLTVQDVVEQSRRFGREVEIIQKGSLEEAAERYGTEKHPMTTIGANESAYDFKAGAEWQKEQDLVEMAQSKSPLSVAYANRCFENGKQAMKEEMMKNAADGKVIKSYNPVTAIGQSTLHGIELIYPDKGKPYLVAGDKVKIIVIPEEK